MHNDFCEATLYLTVLVLQFATEKTATPAKQWLEFYSFLILLSVFALPFEIRSVKFGYGATC
jgi:hypothetical protein